MISNWLTIVLMTFVLSIYGVGALMVSAVVTFAVLNAMKLGQLDDFVWAASTIVGVATMITYRQMEDKVAD